MAGALSMRLPQDCGFVNGLNCAQVCRISTIDCVTSVLQHLLRCVGTMISTVLGLFFCFVVYIGAELASP